MDIPKERSDSILLSYHPSIALLCLFSFFFLPECTIVHVCIYQYFLRRDTMGLDMTGFLTSPIEDNS